MEANIHIRCIRKPSDDHGQQNTDELQGNSEVTVHHLQKVNSLHVAGTTVCVSTVTSTFRIS